jgi:hypothetical protein
MDLTNKTISIKSLAINNVSQTSEATVDVIENVTSSISRVYGTYQLNFNNSFLGIDDPALLLEINTVLGEV